MSDHVLVIVGDEQTRPMGDTQVDTVRSTLRAAGARMADTVWLAPGTACEFGLQGLSSAQATDIARPLLDPFRLDVAVVPTQNRRKKLLVADMESTIIENEMLDELADFLGLRQHIAAITARAMNGEIDFAGALRERVSLLRDLPASRLDEAAQRIRYMSGAHALVATMQKYGAYCALVSGGFTYFTAMVRRHVGFDEDRANTLLVGDGYLLGTVGEPILGREAKLQALEDLAARFGLSLEQTVSIGDGANDLPMLQAAGLGVAYHAKPAVAAATGVRIDHGDLHALLYLQGYRKDEIASQGAPHPA